MSGAILIIIVPRSERKLLTSFEHLFIMLLQHWRLVMRAGISPRLLASGRALCAILAKGYAKKMMQLKPIGVVRSRYTQQKGTPIQPRWGTASEGTVELLPEFAPGLRDLVGFDRIWLLYWFDRAKPATLDVVPYLDTQSRGTFATRAPARPNPIGLSCVRLLAIQDNHLRISDIDVLDGTLLLDIKPYVPDFDVFDVERVGWYTQAKGTGSADDRFAAKEDNFCVRVRQIRALREGE